MTTCTTPVNETMIKTYVVFIERKAGVYEKLSEANAEVHRYPGACYNFTKVTILEKRPIKHLIVI